LYTAFFVERANDQQYIFQFITLDDDAERLIIDEVMLSARVVSLPDLPCRALPQTPMVSSRSLHDEGHALTELAQGAPES
jgi:hypothetical protein